MTDVSSGCWISAHLFFSGGVYSEAADTIIRDVVEPLAAESRRENRASSYFFIRYGELGPHVRLRLRVDVTAMHDTADWLLRRVSAIAPHADLQSFGAVANSNPLSLTALGPGGRHDSAALVGLRWIPYEPEITRYGGESATRLAEAFFEASSDVAIAQLKKMQRGTRASRLGKALLANLTIFHAASMHRQDAARAAFSYGAGYLKTLAATSARDRLDWERTFGRGFAEQAEKMRVYVEHAWALFERAEHPEPLRALAAAIRHTRTKLSELVSTGSIVVYDQPVHTWLECAQRIVPSYVHMMNNRLGVTVAEEAYLAHVLTWTLSGAGVSSGLDLPAV